MTDAPYRAPVVAIAKTSPRARRPNLISPVGVAIAASAAVVVPFASALALWLGVIAIYPLYRTYTSAHRRAVRILAQLPFPVHDRPRPPEPDGYKTGIQQVTVRLAKPLDGVASEAVCGDAMHVAPGLSVAAREDTLVLTSWPWGKSDISLLAQLLETWGRALHAQYGIAGVDVAWRRLAGPPTGF